MSLSINNYTSNSTYKTTQSDTSSTVTAHHHLHRHSSKIAASGKQETAGDSLQLSQEMMEYLAGYQNTTPVSTETYGSDSGENALTSDQKKLILADLQARLNGIDAADSGTKTSGTDPLSTVKEELSGFDASSATDQQISDLFDEVAQTLQSSRPPGFGGEPPEPPEQAGGASGLPPMMKAMGGVLPPFAWGIDESGDSQSSDDTEVTLTADQKKSILADIQAKLSKLDSTQSGSTTSGSQALSAIKNELSEFDASKATDDQVSDLFDEVAQTIEQYLTI